MKSVLVAALLSFPLLGQNDEKILLRYYIPQIVDGGSWRTSVVIYNANASTSASGVLNFFTDTGAPLQLPVIVGGVSQQNTDHVSITVAPNGSITVESLGQSSTTTQGYATFVRQIGNATFLSTYRQRVTGRPDFETTIEGSNSLSSTMVAPYDNTNGFSTAFAIVNADSVAATFVMTFYDTFGGVVSVQAFLLGPVEHMAFSSPSKFPDTQGKAGVVRISRVAPVLNPVPIWHPYMSLAVLRFNPTGASAAMPVLR